MKIKFFMRLKKKIMLSSRLRYHGKFYNRSNRHEKLCIVLAGYKSFLYESVFKRIEKYIDDDIDVCVVTSGLYSDEIRMLCEKNEWSYLSTKENNVSLVQNVAISLHPNAKYIFKLDEDIFITKDYFKKMMSALMYTKNSDYRAGIVCPIIPINGYGYMRVLSKLNLMDTYFDLFEKPTYGGGIDKMIENSPSVARFFWGEGGNIPNIDNLNKIFENDEIKVLPCSIRMSIGAVLFERELWEKMWYFKVKRFSNSMGEDEAQICSFCLLNSRAIMVSENIVVGHLGFAMQNKSMKEYYIAHKELFRIKNEDE